MKKYVPKAFWQQYWDSKNLVKKISKRHFFKPLFDTHFSHLKDRTLIEIGGFPGTYAIYLAKFYGLKTTLLDYVEDKKLLREMLEANKVNGEKVTSLKTDFLRYTPTSKYDAVVSFGFVEHFDDTNEIITRHVALCKKGGTILIAIPNFLGLNGKIQQIYDPENLKVHNLKAMDCKVLEDIMARQKVREYTIKYYGGLLIWLERMNKRPLLLQMGFLIVNCIGLCLKFLGFNARWSSPYIIISATK
jgi:2-polyprenyl-3-methyl-5-hydroxy-6-metoxy-1,4-benzoquinol methylase